MLRSLLRILAATLTEYPRGKADSFPSTSTDYLEVNNRPGASSSLSLLGQTPALKLSTDQLASIIFKPAVDEG